MVEVTSILYSVVAVGLVLVVLVKTSFKPYKPTHTREHYAKVDYKKKNYAQALPPKVGAAYAVVGTGFVGKNIISSLLLRGEQDIKAIDMFPCKEYENDDRVKVITANVTNYDQLRDALKGVDTVYATFAVIKFSQRLKHEYAVSHSVNVVGTENLIKACKECNVKYLIQTSTSNVNIGHDRSGLDLDESMPYTEKPWNHYSTTKVMAEKIVLAANKSKTKNGGTLYTGSIRPCSAVFGFGDKLGTEAMLHKSNMNIALGHLLLENKLRTDVDAVSGQAFCISNEDPISKREWYDIWKALYPKCQITDVPTLFIQSLAYFSETVQSLGKGKLSLGELDMLTPSTFNLMTKDYTFSSQKANKLLGYKAVYTTAEAIQKTIDLYETNKK